MSIPTALHKHEHRQNYRFDCAEYNNALQFYDNDVSTHLTLDLSLRTDARVWIADATTVAAADFARRAYVLAGVLLARVDLLDARLTQHDAALTCRHRLQKEVVVHLQTHRRRVSNRQDS